MKTPHQTSRQTTFTLIELLVVIAIISVLASMLLPALSQARSRAKATTCLATLKQHGVALIMYEDEFDGFLITGKNNGTYSWHMKARVYLGYSDTANSLAHQPQKGGRIFTCPEQPEGNFTGQWPSFHINANLGQEPGKGWDENGTDPYKASQFREPWAKVYIGDAGPNSFFGPQYFYSSEAPEGGGRVEFRHAGHKANIAFLDGHSVGYTYPPIPFAKSLTVGGQWLKYDTSAAPGL